MVYMSMSFGNAIFIALYCISCATGITKAFESYYAEQAAYSLADVAHFHQFKSEIRSNKPQWYHEGTQIFAFVLSPYYWTKRNLTWTFFDDPVVMPRDIVIEAVQAACDKWAAVSTFTFQRVPPLQQPDIRIEARPVGSQRHDIRLVFDLQQYNRDIEGVTLQFTNTPLWAGRNREGGINFRFAVLYQMGRILGLGNSEVSRAVMHVSENGAHPGYKLPYDYQLTDDDKEGIQTKYPESTTQTSRPPDSPDDSSSSSEPPSPSIFGELVAR